MCRRIALGLQHRAPVSLKIVRFPLRAIRALSVNHQALLHRHSVVCCELGSVSFVHCERESVAEEQGDPVRRHADL